MFCVTCLFSTSLTLLFCRAVLCLLLLLFWVRKTEPEDREAFVGKLRSSKVRFENCIESVVGFHKVTEWFVLYSFFIFLFFSPGVEQAFLRGIWIMLLMICFNFVSALEWWDGWTWWSL